MRNFVGSPFRPALGCCLFLVFVGGLLAGCNRQPDIVQYTIDPKPPAALRVETRILGAIVPYESEVWFYKLTGEVPATEEIADQFRRWAAGVQFQNGSPELVLPEGWTKKPGSAMRFATIEIPVGDPPLEVTISKLAKNDEWESLVNANVNRWRGQVGMGDSSERWAGAEPLKPGDDAVEPAIWVDVRGEGSPASMSPNVPPFAAQLGQAMGPQMSPQANGNPPTGGDAVRSSTTTPPSSASRVKYDKPDQWQEGRTSSMRWAAFTVGPADKSAELTVIPAGGDLRGNIERWIGQIRPEGVTAEEVDAVISKGATVTVDGIESQRFIMSGTGAAPQAIDATIVPLGEGFSLFIKMTGDAETVAAESDRIQKFLDSLKLNI